GVVHLARRSLAEGGDSEIGGDVDGVVIARSLSTSVSGGRDIEVWGRTVILAPIVMSVEGGGIIGSIPSGGKIGSSTGTTIAESAGAKCSSSPPPPRPYHPHPHHQRHPQMNRRHYHLHHIPRP
ncbi:hypothetical protein Tco_0376290, partial [Tanacetum coccineum]